MGLPLIHRSHDLYYPPIPRPPGVCEKCGLWDTDERIDEPCSEEVPEPTEAQLEALYGDSGSRAREEQVTTWRQHQELHR